MGLEHGAGLVFGVTLSGASTVVRTHSENEAILLRQEKVGKVFLGEHELAAGMTRHILANLEMLQAAPDH